jgi:hypothetical protein
MVKKSPPVAIAGVAYFTENAPVKGSEEFSINFEEQTWLFASAKNRELFAAEP